MCHHAWFYVVLGIEPKALCILNKTFYPVKLCVLLFLISAFLPTYSHVTSPCPSALSSEKMKMSVGPTHMVAKAEDWPDLL